MNKPCPGSGVVCAASCASTLCYCGRTFRRRFRSLKPWTVPEHEHKRDQREQSEQVIGAVIDASDAREMGFELI